MDLIREYWWAIPVALGIALILFLLLRPRQRVTLTDSAPVRPHMAVKSGESDKAQAGPDATTGIMAAALHRTEHHPPEGDDLTKLKGVGPRFAEAFVAHGLLRFEQIAGLSPTEVQRLDEHLGAFRGRITRDRIVEQAEYLARNDIDGFEQRFGKL